MEKAGRAGKYSKVLWVVLALAIALTAAGCGGESGGSDGGSGEGKTYADGETVGEGATEFTMEIVDQDGGETRLTVLTDEGTVGSALLEYGLIAGEDGDYGLYVKTVNGITADYDKDGVYWAFYIDGEYASTGVDATDVTAGAVYAFKAEKAS